VLFSFFFVTFSFFKFCPKFSSRPAHARMPLPLHLGCARRPPGIRLYNAMPDIVQLLIELLGQF